MRILLCDDDLSILNQLNRYICDFFKSNELPQPNITLYKSGEDLLSHEKQADIAFLDVEMEGISGIRVGSKLMQNNPHIKIFIVTSFPDYLDEAMQFHVFRYLSKPIDKNRLFKNLKEAIYQHNIETVEFPIITNEGVFIRRSDEIICVEAMQRKVYVYAANETFKSSETMDIWRNRLTLPCFYSPHRSYIVNMRYVFSLGKDTVVLKHNEFVKEAYVTRRKYGEFKKTYLLY